MTSAFLTESASEHSAENVLPAIAHELRQPLSAIESIAYYLLLTFSDDDKNREQLIRVQQLVEQSNWILANGLGVSDPRRAEPEPVDLEDLIGQIISARPASLDPPLHCEFARDLTPVHVDPVYGRALIENILGLFRQLATEAHPIELRTTPEGNGAAIEVSTGIQGYRSLASLPPGSVLSLDSARHVAILHRGACSYSIDPVSGIRVRVMLP